MRELPPPSEQRDAVAEYLVTLEHRFDALDHYADAIDKAPTQGPAPDRRNLEDETTKAYTQAVALGLEKCNGGVDFNVDTTSSVPFGGDQSGTTPSTSITPTTGDEFSTPDG
jgi:hypothetical protein